MSDWRYNGREDDQGRYASDDDTRRDFDDERRWSDRERERRSFEARHPDPARGGFTGMSFGEADFMPQDQGGRDFRGEDYGRGGYRSHELYGRGGSQGAPRGGQGRQAYGPEGRPQDWGHSPYSQNNDYRAFQDRRDERRFEPQEHRGGERAGYGQHGGALGVNPPLQRITDGETDHGLRANMGGHRGRGPKNYTRSDDRIREDVSDRLCDDPWLDASEIEVQVSSCEVTLSGSVQSREDRRRAEDLVEQVSGVKHVQNNLRVQPQSQSQSQAQSAPQPPTRAEDIPANAGGSAPPVT